MAEAVGFYEDILRDPESERFEKREPQVALGNMRGPDSPFKIAPTRPDGQSAYILATIIAALSDDELAVMRRIHFRVQNQRALEDGRTIDDCKLLTASLVENGHLPGGPDISGLVIGVEGRESAAEPSRPSGHGCLRVTPQITFRLGVQNEFASIPGFPQSMPATFLCLFSL